MKRYEVKFTYQNRNAKGLSFINAERTITANSGEEAVRKIELSLCEKIFCENIIKIEGAAKPPKGVKK